MGLRGGGAVKAKATLRGADGLRTKEPSLTKGVASVWPEGKKQAWKGQTLEGGTDPGQQNLSLQIRGPVGMRMHFYPQRRCEKGAGLQKGRWWEKPNYGRRFGLKGTLGARGVLQAVSTGAVSRSPRAVAGVREELRGHSWKWQVGWLGATQPRAQAFFTQNLPGFGSWRRGARCLVKQPIHWCSQSLNGNLVALGGLGLGLGPFSVGLQFGLRQWILNQMTAAYWGPGSGNTVMSGAWRRDLMALGSLRFQASPCLLSALLGRLFCQAEANDAFCPCRDGLLGRQAFEVGAQGLQVGSALRGGR